MYEVVFGQALSNEEHGKVEHRRGFTGVGRLTIVGQEANMRQEEPMSAISLADNKELD